MSTATTVDDGTLKTPQDVLSFWFGDRQRLVSDPNYKGQRLKLWFGGGDSNTFNEAQVASKDLIELAAAGGSEWTGSNDAALARIIVLDQFPRTVHRATAASFQYEQLAAELCHAVIDAGLDKEMSACERLFLYLPLMHSEKLSDQEKCVELFTASSDMHDNLGFAQSHLAVVAQFGRFPHRNRALNRETTPEEREWLSSDKVPAWARIDKV